MAVQNLERRILPPVKMNLPPPLDNQQEEENFFIKALEGYFGNLAAVAVNEKSVLQQLVLNNTTLTTSNESLVDLLKRLNVDIKNLERKTRASIIAERSAPVTEPSATITRRRAFTYNKHATRCYKTRTSAPWL